MSAAFYSAAHTTAGETRRLSGAGFVFCLCRSHRARLERVVCEHGCSACSAFSQLGLEHQKQTLAPRCLFSRGPPFFFFFCRTPAVSLPHFLTSSTRILSNNYQTAAMLFAVGNWMVQKHRLARAVNIKFNELFAFVFFNCLMIIMINKSVLVRRIIAVFFLFVFGILLLKTITDSPNSCHFLFGPQ